jgi:tetratricopeptide (TPR) repeat protein
VDEAIRHFEQALRIDPKIAGAHGALGAVWLKQGRWAEARDSMRRCLDLLPQGHPQRWLAAQQLRRCERLLALEARLPAILKGQARPADAAEQLGLADLCKTKRRYAAAARFYADAFAADPQRADHLRPGHRYNAACCAALAAGEQGTDAPKRDDPERARLRGQALNWLRADLAAWAKVADRALVRRKLAHWQQDPDLAGVRGREALAALPAEERAQWEKLWAEVADLLRRLDAAKPAAAPAGK